MATENMQTRHEGTEGQIAVLTRCIQQLPADGCQNCHLFKLPGKFLELYPKKTSMASLQCQVGDAT